MRKAFISNGLGAKMVTWFALALGIVLGLSAPASAQLDSSSWQFVNVPVDYSKFTGTGTVGSGAILAATDSSGFSSTLDGALKAGKGGDIFLKKASGNGLDLSSKPILANVQNGDQLVLAALITNVSPVIVADLKNGSTTHVANIIAEVTADFPAEFFGSNISASLFTGLNPVGATGVPSGAFGSSADTSNTVVVWWEGISNLVVSATAHNTTVFDIQGATATLQIADNPGNATVSNPVGAEIGTPQLIGPVISSATITVATDTTTELAWTGSTSNVKLFPANSNNFQFRQGDQVQIDFKVTTNDAKDGEPNALFDNKGDALVFPGLSPSSAEAEVKNSSGSTAALSARANGLGNLAILKGDFITSPNQTGGSLTVSATGTVKGPDEGVTTFGPDRNLRVTLRLADDVNNATDGVVGNTNSSGSSPVKLDTLPPAVTNIKIEPEKANLTGVTEIDERKRVTPQRTDNDEVKITIDVVPGEESLTNLGWLNMKIDDTGAGLDGVALTNVDIISGSTNPIDWTNQTRDVAIIADASQVTTVQNTGSGTITGVQTKGDKVKLTANNVPSPSATLIAGVVVVATDDARNQAKAKFSGTGSDRIKIFSAIDWQVVHPTGNRSVDPVTVAVDNNNPVIGAATVSVIAMPPGYFNGTNLDSDAQKAAFNLLHQTSETINASTEALGLNLTLSQILANAPNITLVTRAALGQKESISSVTGDQSGSPIRIVVEFNPAASAGQANDLDDIVPAGLDVNTYIEKNFPVVFTKPQIGLEKKIDGNNVQSNRQTWTFKSGSGTSSANVWFTTWELTGGIPGEASEAVGGGNSQLGTDVIAGGSDNVQIDVSLFDSGMNASATDSASSLIVDVTRPRWNFFDVTNSGAVGFVANYALTSGIAGSGPNVGAKAASTIVLVTRTNGKTLTQFEAEGFDRDAGNFFVKFSKSGSGSVAGATSDDFVNGGAFISGTSPALSTPNAATSPPELKPGDTIIISANFDEQTIGGADDIFSSIGGQSGFPFLLSIDAPGSATQRIDAASTMYGRRFRTLTANFTDFVDENSAKDLLPDVSSAVGGGPITAIEAGDLISATWVFTINPAGNLNDTIGSATSDVRSVTLTMRDLSGNVTRVGVPVGFADFQGATVQPLSYTITTPNRFVDLNGDGVAETEVKNATLQNSVGINANVGSFSAFQVSAATAADNSTLELVVLAENGPFTGTGGLNTISADFKDFSLGLEQADSTRDLTTGSALVANTTRFLATFTIDNIPSSAFTNTAAAGVTIRVTDSSGRVTSDSNNVQKIQADAKAVIVNAANIDIIEKTDTSGNVIINGQSVAGDDSSDQQLRPGQALIVEATATLDSYETSSTVRPGIKLTLNASNFGQTGLIGNPSLVRSDGNNFRYRFEFNVGSSGFSSGFANVTVNATDVAGNVLARTSSNTALVENDSPSIASNNVVLNANSPINWVSGVAGTAGSFRQIKRSGAGVDTEVLGGGVTLRVTSEINKNDLVFNDLDEWNITADFSQFNGNNNVSPSSLELAGSVIRATWVQSVSASGEAIPQASVAITAIDPAGLSSGRVNSATAGADRQKPDVNIDVKFFNGNVELNPNNDDISNATIVVKVVGTYNDFDTFLTSLNGPGQVIAGAATSNSDVPNKVTEAISIDISDFTGKANDTRRKPTFWALGDAADELDIRSDSSPSPTDDQLRLANKKVITAWFGATPDGSGGLVGVSSGEQIQVNQSGGVANANVVASVTDTVGNFGTASSANVQFDNQAPTISDQMLDLAPGQVSFANGGFDFFAALHDADGNILRPTRVSDGTQLTMRFNVQDQVSGLDAASIEWRGFDKDRIDVFPNISGTGVVEVSATASVDKSNLSSTFPPAINNPLSVSTFNIGNLNNFPAIILNATDTSGNGFGTAGQTFRDKFELDISGPVISASALAIFEGSEESLVNSYGVGDIANNSNNVPNNQVANLKPGQRIIWAASMVVDGTDVINGNFVHFQNFLVDWTTALPNRLETTSVKTGIKTIVASATRAVILATSTAQVKPDAISSSAVQANVEASDAFGNRLETTTNNVAINARGPRATETLLTVDGKNRIIQGSLQNLGIGSVGIDASSASFEVRPGNRFILDATITTVEGQIPDTITADFSSLYPSALKNSVDEVLPTSVQITQGGIVAARWERVVTFNTARNIRINNVNIGQGIPAFADIDHVTDTKNNSTGTLFAGSVTPVTIALDGVSDDDSINANQLTEIRGLPFIQVQESASANKEVRINVKVNDVDSPFPEETTQSSKFAVDSKRPTATYSIAVTDRELDPENTDSTGFPLAPNASSSTNKRVRGNDMVKFNVAVTNPSIGDAGNDRFAKLPAVGESFNLENAQVFKLSDDPSLVEVAADLSEFTVGGNDERAAVGGDMNEVVINQSAVPAVIDATFFTTVSTSIGTSASASNQVRNITPTIFDDAGLSPKQNSGFASVNTITRNTNLAVDNRAPAISGSLEIVDLNSGIEISGGDPIPAESVLQVTATITDTVDNPFDVVVNSAGFGNAALTALGIDLPPGNIELLAGETESVGVDSIAVPFRVTMPAATSGTSAGSFNFIIRATDTVGNSRSVASFDVFQFDALPNITVSRSLEGEVNADDTLTLTAEAFDVGGMDSVQWILPANQTVAFSPVPSSATEFVVTDTTGSNTLTLGVGVTPTLGTGDIAFDLVARATDDAGSVSIVTETVTVNQPALFAEVLDVTTTSSAGAVAAATLEAGAQGWNQAAGEDIREVTIEEGDELVVDFSASDVGGDAVVFDATGSALAEDRGSLETASSGLHRFTFAPGFLAVTGGANSATFALNVKSRDGSGITPDNTDLLINVLPVAATPVIDLSTVTIVQIDGTAVAQNVEFGANLSVREGESLIVDVNGSDAGNATLDFNAVSDPLGVELDVAEEVGEGTVNAQVTFSPNFEFSDISKINFDNPVDPFSLDMSVTNGTFSAEGTLGVDVLNTSQPPILAATATVNGGAAVQLIDGATIAAQVGSQVVFQLSARDPDGDNLFLPTIEASGPEGIQTDRTITGSGSRFNVVFTVNIPDNLTSAEGAVAINVTFSAEDQTGESSTNNFTIEVEEVPVVVPAEIEEVVISQGLGGSTAVNIRNMDPDATRADGTPLAITSILRSFNGAANLFLERIGGGGNRSTFTALGDVDGDGDTDVVSTMGPTTASATTPNIVVPRDARTRVVTGHSFVAFQPTAEGAQAQPVDFAGGDVRVAIGNFIGSSTAEQIATAQGIGGSGVVRIFQYTGLPAPNGYAVVRQFNGLAGAASTNNASGAVHLAAGDLDADGIDELVVSQTNSSTSLTQFQVLDVLDGFSAVRRTPFAAFRAAFRTADGSGARPAVLDVDGDGTNEIVFTSDGPGVALGEAKNFITFVKPIVDESGQITGFERPGNSGNGVLFSVFSEAANPSNAVSIGAGELDGVNNGEEIVVGTSVNLIVNGLNVTADAPAPESRYRILKINYDGDTVTGFSSVVGPGAGFRAFVGDFTVSSGAVNISVGEIE